MSKTTAYVLQFFSLISDSLGSVSRLQNQACTNLNTSGLNLMSNSVSLRELTARAAFLTISFVDSSMSFFSPLVMESVKDSTIFLASSSSNLDLSDSASTP